VFAAEKEIGASALTCDVTNGDIPTSVYHPPSFSASIITSSVSPTTAISRNCDDDFSKTTTLCSSDFTSSLSASNNPSLTSDAASSCDSSLTTVLTTSSADTLLSAVDSNITPECKTGQEVSENIAPQTVGHHKHEVDHIDANICDNSMSVSFDDAFIRSNQSSFCSDWDSNSLDASEDYYYGPPIRQTFRKSQKRKAEPPIVEKTNELLFDKLPNYYTALSIPSRAVAGSATRSSSDLIAEFARHDRDPSPDRCSEPVYDKLPAYHSSFTNSTRYDDREFSASPVTFTSGFDGDFVDENRAFGEDESNRFGCSAVPYEFTFDGCVPQKGSTDKLGQSDGAGYSGGFNRQVCLNQG